MRHANLRACIRALFCRLAVRLPQSCRARLLAKLLLHVFLSVQADLAKFGDQVARPAIDIVFFYDAPHALDAKLLVLRLHLDRDPNCLGGLFDVVRIHQQSIAQLARRAGELAQDQHSALVPASCEKFLRDQVHAVMQRSDQAEIGCAVVRLNLLMAVLAIQKDDRLPLSALETPVDALRFGFHFGQQIVIALDVGAAGRSDLDEGELALIAGIFFKKALDGKKALEDSLCVVDAVDSDSDVGRIDPQAAQ